MLFTKKQIKDESIVSLCVITLLFSTRRAKNAKRTKPELIFTLAMPEGHGHPPKRQCRAGAGVRISNLRVAEENIPPKMRWILVLT